LALSAQTKSLNTNEKFEFFEFSSGLLLEYGCESKYRRDLTFVVFRHGQHLALIFKECRKPWKKCLKLDFKSEIAKQEWKGSAIIPWDYFPSNVNKFNAYGIHGVGDDRVYEALFPVPEGLFEEPNL